MNVRRQAGTVRAAIVLAVASLAAPLGPAAWAQGGVGVDQVLSGQTVPLTVPLGQLTPDWRRVSIGGAGDAGGGGGMMGIFAMMFGGGGPGAPASHYTRGQTVTLVGGEVFLVTYRVQAPPMDFAALMRQGPGAGPPPPVVLTPQTLLSLALVNLRTITSLSEIRAFDLQQEIRESQEAAEQFGELLRQQSQPQPPDEAPQLLGQPAPPTRLPDITGRERTLEEFRGRIVLLNFFASW
jgi:hypothetical protein